MSKIVYARLAQFAGKNGYAYPKQPTLAKAIGCPVRNLQRYIDELKHHKLIESVQQGLGKPNLYYFLWHTWMDGGEELTDDEIDELENPTLATDTPLLAEQDMPEMAEPVTPSMAPPLKRRESGEVKDSPPPLSRGEDSAQPIATPKTIRRKKCPRVQPDYDAEGYRDFYAAYPKHMAPQEAMNAWDAGQPDKALQALILENVRARARADPEWQKDGGKYIPHPATYLRNGRWMDEWKPILRNGVFVE